MKGYYYPSPLSIGRRFESNDELRGMIGNAIFIDMPKGCAFDYQVMNGRRKGYVKKDSSG